MNNPRVFVIGLILAAGAALSGALPAAAEVRPSSDLLLPWFEVDLEGGSATTFFALANSSDEPVEVLVSIQTNWGVPVLSLGMTLAGGRIETVDLRDWLVLGRLLSGVLGAAELAHLQAALAGRASPRDGLYYASPPAVTGRITGSITFRAEGVPRPDALWGDFILSDAGRGAALAEALINLDPTVEPRPDCSRHSLRFLAGPQGEMASELRLWSRRRGEPSVAPEIPETSRIHAIAEVFDEAGRRLATHDLDLPPVAGISLLDLTGNEPFGRIDLTTSGDSFAGVVVRDEKGMSMLLPAVCLPDRTGSRLQLAVLINGEEALALPGPSLPVGEMIDWRYVVTNTGDTPISNILVSDVQGIVIGCPGEVLAPGESMTCTGMSAAVACQQEMAAQVTAQTPAGETVEAGGSACYFGGTYGRAALDLETSIAGEDADVPPGPTLEAKDPSPFPYAGRTYWQYQVENTGAIPLSGLTVSGERTSDPYCSKDTLEPGESMTCSLVARPELGLNHELSKVTGVTSCGLRVEDEDLTYYLGVEPKMARIDIESLVGGYDTFAPGPVYLAGSRLPVTHIVLNSGEVTLLDVHAQDDGRNVHCPKTQLDAGESMICTSAPDIIPGPQTEGAWVLGHYGPRYLYPFPCPPRCYYWQASVMDTDVFYYFGAAPVIDLEVFVNGEDADAPPGPEIPEGSPVEWTYTMTNPGNTSLLLVKVVDEQGAEVPGCFIASLEPGASASCSVTGTAIAGPRQSTASITGTPFVGPIHPPGAWTGAPVTDSDSTHYAGVPAGSKGGKP